MTTVALTGGIGSGKSMVCSILSRRGIPVYDCDSAAKSLYSRVPGLIEQVEDRLGCRLRLPDGGLDRKTLASVIFSSPEKLAALESVIHPAVLEDYLEWNSLQDSILAEGAFAPDTFYGSGPFAVIESAIILSKPDFMEHVSKVVLVDAPSDIRTARACLRDGSTPRDVSERMNAQRFDLSKVDFIIDNSGTAEQLEKAVEATFSKLSL
ncbi:MAG: dephospho-CoA kinase [Bacteroidales bacterium]|nr:dephospho-CoA kinase [Bacteroidales bacterium]